MTDEMAVIEKLNPQPGSLIVIKVDRVSYGDAVLVQELRTRFPEVAFLLGPKSMEIHYLPPEEFKKLISKI